MAEGQQDLFDVGRKEPGIYRYLNTSLCRFCPQPVLWFTTPSGGRMPIDQAALFEAFPRLAQPGALKGMWTTKARGAIRLLPYNHWARCENAERARQPSELGPGDHFQEAP